MADYCPVFHFNKAFSKVDYKQKKKKPALGCDNSSTVTVFNDIAN
jgi:hypothetical protein